MILKDKKSIAIAILSSVLVAVTIYTIGVQFEWWGKTKSPNYTRSNEIMYSYLGDQEKIKKNKLDQIDIKTSDSTLIASTIDRIEKTNYNTELSKSKSVNTQTASKLFLNPIKDVIRDVTGIDPNNWYYDPYENTINNDGRTKSNMRPSIYSLYYSTFLDYINKQEFPTIDTVTPSSNEAYNLSKFNEKKENFNSGLKLIKIENSKDLEKLRRDLKEISVMVKDFSKEFDEINKTSSNSRLISLAIPIFALSLILFLIVPAIYRTGRTQRAILLKGRLPDIITVFLLTAVILILGMGSKLSPEVLGTLLGGISVYVLQGRLSEKNNNGHSTAAGQLKADFIVSQSIGHVGDEIAIADNSTGVIKEYTWLFANATPNSATGVGPHTIVYSSPGVYSVVLNIKGETGNSSITKYIQVFTKTVSPIPTNTTTLKTKVKISLKDIGIPYDFTKVSTTNILLSNLNNPDQNQQLILNDDFSVDCNITSSEKYEMTADITYDTVSYNGTIQIDGSTGLETALELNKVN